MDSGAEANCITLLECKRLQIQFSPTTQTAVAVDKKTRVPVLGEVKTSFERNGLIFYFEGLVCPELTNEIIGGLPFLKTNKINQELNNNRISVHQNEKVYYIMEIPSMSPSTRALQSRIVILKDSTPNISILPSEHFDVKLSPDFQPDQSYILEPSLENKNNSWLPQEVQAVGNTIRVTNHTNQPIIIPTDAHMLRVRPTYDLAKDPHDHEDDHAAAYVSYVRLDEDDAIADVTKDVRIDPSLTKKQKEKLISIHKKFGNVFDGDLREGYNGHSGFFDVDFNWIQNTRPPVNNTKAPNFCKKKEDKDLLQAMIDKLESQQKCAKARDLGIIPPWPW